MRDCCPNCRETVPEMAENAISRGYYRVRSWVVLMGKMGQERGQWVEIGEMLGKMGQCWESQERAAVVHAAC